MDADARAAQSLYMDIALAARAATRNQLIIDSIATSAAQRVALDSPTATLVNATQQESSPLLRMVIKVAQEASAAGSLKNASVTRLACLFRHWTWADEALTQFERELAEDWEDGEEPLADHPFGAYYHWCALLCALAEAALEHGLLTGSQLDPLRSDLDNSFAGLRACRELLVVVPNSLEEHPRIVDLLRDSETLARLRRIHNAFGEALRKEQLSREIERALDEY
jgi:hypothetical protein